MFARMCFALALGLQHTAGVCPSGAKPFPASEDYTKLISADLFTVDYYTSSGTSYKVIKYPLRSYRSSHPDEALKSQPVPPMVLYQCGTPKPSTSDPGIQSDGARFFEIPIQKATLAWGGSLSFFELLSVTEAIWLIDLTYIANPCAQLMEYCTPGVHDNAKSPNWASSTGGTQVSFTNTFGTGYGGHPELDVPFEITRDPGMLNRAEWIKFIAAFFNEEHAAHEIYEKIRQDYNALKQLGAQIKADKNSKYGGRAPNVLWVDQGPLSGSRPLRVNNKIFQRQLTQDAGGEMVLIPEFLPAGCTERKESDGSITVQCAKNETGKASFKKFLKLADIIIDQEADYSDLSASAMKSFSNVYGVTTTGVPAFEASPPHVFTPDRVISDAEGVADDKKSGRPWTTLAQSQPQRLLAGLMEVMWGDEFESSCDLTYLRRRSSPEHQTVMSHDACPLYSSDNSHDCAGIHTYMHDVPLCAPGAKIGKQTAPPSTTPSPTDVSSASRVRVWFAAVVAALAPL